MQPLWQVHDGGQGRGPEDSPTYGSQGGKRGLQRAMWSEPYQPLVLVIHCLIA